MNHVQESTMAIIAALLVLFAALLAPPVAAVLAVCLLVVFAIIKHTQGWQAGRCPSRPAAHPRT